MDGDTATEAATNPSNKRKQIEDYIITHINEIDKSGSNGKRYKAMFKAMSDEDFHQFMEDLKNHKTKIVFYAPNMIVKIKMEDILAVAKKIGLKLFERIKLWDTVTRRYYITPKEYLVVRIPIRRLKQYLKSKLSVPESDTTVNMLTGQVINSDKGSSVSLVEIQTMLAKGLSSSITELANVRGGNIYAYADAKGKMEETGEFSLAELDPDTRVRSAVVLNVYLKSMGFRSNF